MSIKRLFLALAFLLGVAGHAHAAPLEAYGKLPSIEAASVSPSGKQLAIVVTNGERRMILVHDLTTQKITMRADALRKAGKYYELVVQDGADHWLSRGDTRLQTLTATMAFVEKHNPAD